MGFAFVQEGGSSTEMYLQGYDTLENAQNAANACIDASYRVSEIIEVPTELLSNVEYFDAIQRLLKTSCQMDC